MKLSTAARFAVCLVAWFLSCVSAHAQTVVYSQPPSGSGATLTTSYWDPDGSNYDEEVWDSFVIPAGAAINEVRWRGGYSGSSSTQGGNVTKFRVSFYSSISGNGQPDLTSPHTTFTINGKAQETYATTSGGTALYDYKATLSHTFLASANTTYWVQIVAWQSGYPNWGVAPGSGGNGTHFHHLSDALGGFYRVLASDAAFTLLASSNPPVTITASASPSAAGTVSGSGSYPSGSVVSLSASANTGWGFVKWTENGSQVSTSATYNFTATTDRTLVANFSPAYTIYTYASPGYGGTTSGAGTYLDGALVTLTASPRPHFQFAGWSDGSMDQVHTFNAWADMQLTAWFQTEPLSEAFDFDSGPGSRPLPLSWTVNGLTAAFSATGEGYSTQEGGLAPNSGPYPGYLLMPSSVFPADLIVDFSESLVDFSMMYSTQELGCDTSATMRVTVYQDGQYVATATHTGGTTGTWPVNELSISAPAGFNRAVVHYDAKPATCQDWGPIFFADNVIVTRKCVPPTVASQPTDTAVCPSGTAAFAVGSDLPVASYQWQRETAPGSGLFADLLDGSTSGWDGGAPGLGAVVSGATSPALVISADTGSSRKLGAPHALGYRCVLTGECGSVTSDAARLWVCVGDFDCSGFVDTEDFDAFVHAFEQGTDAADVDSSGFVDTDDFDFFVHAFEVGC